jgi:C-terminal processing protease CtpA/Prc
VTRDWSAVADVLMSQLTEHYLHPDVAERICARIRSADYRDLVDEREFADAVTEDMQSVNGDLHLFVRYSEEELTEESTVDESPLRADQAVLTGHGFAKVERLPGNIALLDIRKFYDPTVAGAGAAAIAAMHLVAGADALVLDLRNNRGGEPEMNALVSGFLFDERTHLVDLYFPAADRTLQYWTDSFVPGPIFGGTKPIYVLIGGRTISGGEGMAFQLQQSKRATLIGETTAGAGNFHYPLRLTARLLSAIPSGYPVDPVSGGRWEGVGVLPDIAVPPEQAFDVGYRLSLEHVLGLGEEGARRQVAEDARTALTRLRGR